MREPRPVPAHLPPEVGLLELAQVLAYIPISKANLYRRIAAGEIPAPQKLGARSLWDSGQIRKLLVRGIRTKPPAAGKLVKVAVGIVAREAAAGLEVLLWQRPARVAMPLLLCLPWKLLAGDGSHELPWPLPWQRGPGEPVTMAYKGRWTVSAYPWHTALDGRDLPAGLAGMWCRLAEVPLEQMMGADALILRRYRDAYGADTKQRALGATGTGHGAE